MSRGQGENFHSEMREAKDNEEEERHEDNNHQLTRLAGLLDDWGWVTFYIKAMHMWKQALRDGQVARRSDRGTRFQVRDSVFLSSCHSAGRTFPSFHQFPDTKRKSGASPWQ